MHEMRKTGGYMTVEISALLPIIFDGAMDVF